MPRKTNFPRQEKKRVIAERRVTKIRGGRMCPRCKDHDKTYLGDAVCHPCHQELKAVR